MVYFYCFIIILCFEFPSALQAFMFSYSLYHLYNFVWYGTYLKYKWLLIRKFNISVYTNDLYIYENFFWNIKNIKPLKMLHIY